MSFRVRAVGTIVFVLGSLLAMEGGAALYLRVLAHNPRPLAQRNRQRHLYEAYRGHQLTPGWAADGAVHDAQGFRRREDVPQAKPPGTFRAFLMGGSAAYGLSAPPPFPPVTITNDQTIDAKLEQRLKTLLPHQRVEVINAAVTAYWTHQHLIYLLETILDYDPDLIIFLDGINDHYHTQPDHNQFLSYRYSLPLRVEDLNRPTLSEVLRTGFGWAKQYSYAAYLMDQVLDRALGWSAAPEDPCQLETVHPEQLNADYARQYEAISRRSWVRTLRTVLLLLRDNGVQAIVAAQPELLFQQTAGRSRGDAELVAIETRARPPYYTEKKAFLKPPANQLAAETAADLGAQYIDLTDVFDDRQQYFIDYCHLSEAGADRVAERLAPLVVDAVKQRAAETSEQRG